MIYIGKCCSDICSKSCKCCGEGVQNFCTECWQCNCCPEYAKLPFSTCSIVFSIFLVIPALIICHYSLRHAIHKIVRFCEYIKEYNKGQELGPLTFLFEYFQPLVLIFHYIVKFSLSY